MTPGEILMQMQQMGVELWVDGQRLRYRALRGVLTPTLRDLLLAHKSTLIEALSVEAWEERLAIMATDDVQATITPAGPHEPPQVGEQCLTCGRHLYIARYGRLWCEACLRRDP
jgi:TubC N-terminal docking domain